MLRATLLLAALSPAAPWADGEAEQERLVRAAYLTQPPPAPPLLGPAAAVAAVAVGLISLFGGVCIAYFRGRSTTRPLGFAGAGAGVGLLIAYLSGFWDAAPAGETLPYPHVVPRREGVLSLRFSMIHDVIHERYSRHASAYFIERGKSARAGLKGALPAARRFALMDDLAAGLHHGGDTAGAVRVLTDKLAAEEALGPPDPRTHASLALLLASGKPSDAALRDALTHARAAADLRPVSPFGAEKWLAALIEYQIALRHDPKMATRYDMVGNKLDSEHLQILGHPTVLVRPGVGRTRDRMASANLAARYLADPESVKSPERARDAITRVGSEDGWGFAMAEAAATSVKEPVPFDEPALGIVGLWRGGVGPHPHLAAALGEIMLRAGQRYIAWTAFERAATLPHNCPGDAEAFLAHCRRRQSAIEATLPPAEPSGLKAAFDAELAHGLAQQKAEGEVTPTPPGDADWFHVGLSAVPSWPVIAAVLAAGLFCLYAGLTGPPPEDPVN